MNYYNEIDPYAAQWLGNLANAGVIPSGHIDTRSIIHIEAPRVLVFTQAHFFAGIGGWPLALKMAGWPDGVPVWTGSCPCQPFSICGKKKGEEDERHLWPIFKGFIRDRRPAVVFGEQVASPDGRKWLSGVRADLEGLGYRFGAADMCAAGVSAPHIRQRLYWVADTKDAYWGPGICGAKTGARAEIFGRGRSCQRGNDGRMVDTVEPRLEGYAGDGHGGGKSGRVDPQEDGSTTQTRRGSGPWDQFVFVSCADGKTRRLEPGITPLAHGVPARVGKLRAYGNAIVPQVAATFVKAYMETLAS